MILLLVVLRIQWKKRPEKSQFCKFDNSPSERDDFNPGRYINWVGERKSRLRSEQNVQQKR